MKQVLYTSEVLGNVETERGVCEVCVTAGARYDETAGRLEVELDAFLRTTDLCAKEERLPAGWLPKAETVRESVGSDETVELARDIFHRWVRKVRDTAPALSHA